MAASSTDDVSSASTPLIRSQQFGDEQVGSLPKSVNLFRGNLILGVPLFTLPGKADDDTLTVDVALSYDSNVSQQVGTWNLDQPTGVLGLGWSLSLDAVVRTNDGALGLGAQSYALIVQGIPMPLIPLPSGAILPVRATLGTAATAVLAVGTVSAQVVSALAAQGLAVNPGAQVTAAGPSQWVLADAVNERDFLFSVVGGQASVTDFGQSYQLQEYQFWHVTFYPDYNRWEVVTDKGAVRSFGGGVGATAQGYATSTGNSIQWGVAWASPANAQTAGWTGASSVVTGQMQYATAWYLASVSDPWGNAVYYAYNEFGRDPTSGLLLNGAEQMVGGTGGRPYTKAVYLTSIRSFTGYAVGFSYADKTCTETVQEYMDPHKLLDFAATPGTPPTNLTTPNAYQDCYETLYLTSVTLLGGVPLSWVPLTGTVLSTVTLSYDGPCTAPGVTGPAAQTVKRYLASVTETNAEGQSLPPYRFSYLLTAQSTPANYGALASITYPQGSVASWSYNSVVASNCNRTLTVTPPSGWAAGATPSVWFGDGYAVALWINVAGTIADLSVYTWSGQWIVWNGGPLSVGSAVLTQPITAVLGGNCFALLPVDVNGNCWPVLVGRNPLQACGWTIATQTPSIPQSTQVLSTSGGNNFLTATVTTGSGVCDFWLWSWDWATASFSGVSAPCQTSPNTLYAQATGDACLLAEVQQGQTTLTLSWLNPLTGVWQAGPAAPITVPYDLRENSDRTLHWAVGPSCAALSVSADPLKKSFAAVLLLWDSAYAVTATTLTSFSYGGETVELSIQASDLNGQPFPPYPAIGANGFVSFRQFLFRYDGSAWSGACFPACSTQLPHGWLEVSAGVDVAVEAINTGLGSCTASLLAYDPNAGAFLAQPIALPAAVGTPLSSFGWPNAYGGDYVVAQNSLFYRCSDTSWKTGTAAAVQAFPIFSDESQFISFSVANGAPNFLAAVSQTSGPTTGYNVDVMPLQNGMAPSALATSLSGTVFGYNTPGTTALSPGQGLPGSSTIVYWPSSAVGLAQAPSFTLTQYAALGMSGPITTWTVAGLEVSDGFSGVYRTAYAFEPGLATCDQTGMVVKFLRATVFEGAATPGEAAMGRTVHVFQNGFQQADAAPILDGQPTQTVRFNGAALGSLAYAASFGIDPTAATNAGAPTTITPALQSAIAAACGVTLSAGTTVQYLQNDADLLNGSGGQTPSGGLTVPAYCYWQLVDPATSDAYTLDYSGSVAPGGLNGTLTLYSGSAIEVQSTQWQVFSARNVSATTADAAPMPLYGGLPRPAVVRRTLDGAPIAWTYTYLPAGFAAPPYPLHIGRAYTLTNALGAVETHTDLLTPLVVATPTAAAFNLMVAHSAQRHTVSVAGQTVTTSSRGVVWNGWLRGDGVLVPLPTGEWVWNGDPTGQDNGVFNPAAPGPLWTRLRQVTAATPTGLAREWLDAAGTVHAVQWDVSGAVVRARIANASLVGGQAAVDGFDPDDGPSAWTVSGGAAIMMGTGHFSWGSVTLPAGSSMQRAPLSPDTSRVLVVSASVLTPAGYQPTAGSGWSVTVLSAGKPLGSPVVQPVIPTGGLWQHQSFPVDLPSLAGSAQQVTVVITVSNAAGSTGSVAVDNVLIAPLAVELAVHTYDPVWKLPAAEFNQAGNARWAGRDGFRRMVTRTDPAGALEMLSISYLSALGNVGGFSASDPNAALTMAPLHAGTTETFLDATWTTRWTPSPVGAFAAAGGVLARAGTASGASLTAVTAPTSSSFAMHVDFVPVSSGPLALTDTVALTIGALSFVVESADGGGLSCTLKDGGTAVSPATTVPAPLAAIDLLFVQGRLLVRVNGQQQIAWVGTVSGAPVLSTGANLLALRNLSLLDGVSTHILFTDAAGIHRQEQTLTDEFYEVNHTISDAAANAIAKTKTAPGNWGSGASLPWGTYRSGFVQVPAFLAGLSGGGTMTGDVATWYSTSNPVAPSNDQGYPYSLLEFETRQKGRMIAHTPPGMDGGSRSVFRYAYGNEITMPLPAGFDLPAPTGAPRFRVRQETDPLGNSLNRVSDAGGELIGRYCPSSDLGLASLNTVAYGLSGTTAGLRQPNYYALSNTAFCRTEQRNALGQMCETTSPDEGTTGFLHDGAGRIRLHQDAAAAAGGYAVYRTWDALGRRRSLGIVTVGVGTPLSAFTAQLSNPLWPEGQSVCPVTVQRTWNWDGSGSVPSALGRLTTLTAITPGSTGDTTVVNSFTYDSCGRVATRTVSVTPPSHPVISGTLSFGYDALGRIVSIGYPACVGAGAGVRYRYDGADRIIAIATSAGAPLASYSYNTQSQIAAETRGSTGASSAMTISRNFDSQDRLLAEAITTADGTRLAAALVWNQGNGLTSLSETLTPTIANGGTEQSFGYDPLSRLTSATDSEGGRTVSQSFVTSGGPTECNGNAQTVTAQNVQATLAYTPGTNRVSSTTRGTSTASYEFLPNGLPDTITVPAGSIGFSYVPGSSRPLAVTVPGGGGIGWAVDGEGRRVVRTDSNGPEVTLLGLDGTPMVTIAPDGTGTAWVEGPGGFAAMLAPGKTHLMAVDRLGTPRLVTDVSGKTVAQYAFDCLGNAVVHAEPTPGFLPWGFTGQRWEPTLGLYDFKARFYDPLTGRFIAPDPAEEFASPFSYVANQPNMLVDPSGMSFETRLLQVVLMAAAFGISYVTGGAASAASEELVGVAIDIAGNAASGGLNNLASYVHQAGPTSGNGAWDAFLAGAAGGAAGGVFAGASAQLLKSEAQATKRLGAALSAQRKLDGSQSKWIEMTGKPEAEGFGEAVQRSASKTGSFAKTLGLSTALETAGTVARAYVQNGVTNVMNNQPFNQNAEALLLASGGIGVVAAAFGSYMSFSAECAAVKGDAAAALKSGVNKENLGTLFRSVLAPFARRNGGFLALAAAKATSLGVGYFINEQTKINH